MTSECKCGVRQPLGRTDRGAISAACRKELPPSRRFTHVEHRVILSRTECKQHVTPPLGIGSRLQVQGMEGALEVLDRRLPGELGHCALPGH